MSAVKMNEADAEVETESAEESESFTLDSLAAQLGNRDAAAALFSRIDGDLRVGKNMRGLTIRETRATVGKARVSGKAQLVAPGRPGGSKAAIDVGEALVIVKVDDLAEVVRAAHSGFSWSDLFSPRADLNAAVTLPARTQGSRGRRQLSF